MWPSAADKKDEPNKIQWLSKTQEEKERDIEKDLENDDYYEPEYVPPRK